MASGLRRRGALRWRRRAERGGAGAAQMMMVTEYCAGGDLARALLLDSAQPRRCAPRGCPPRPQSCVPRLPAAAAPVPRMPAAARRHSRACSRGRRRSQCGEWQVFCSGLRARPGLWQRLPAVQALRQRGRSAAGMLPACKLRAQCLAYDGHTLSPHVSLGCAPAAGLTCACRARCRFAWGARGGAICLGIARGLSYLHNEGVRSRQPMRLGCGVALWTAAFYRSMLRTASAPFVPALPSCLQPALGLLWTK